MFMSLERRNFLEGLGCSSPDNVESHRRSLWSALYSPCSNLRVPQICRGCEKLNPKNCMDTKHSVGHLHERIHTQLTSNTLWNRATPVSIALTFSQTGALQTMGGVADIDSNWPRDDATVAHNTTCELSTVLQQSNTSLICSCVLNTKVCKCTTCQDSKISCIPPLVYVKDHLYSLNLS